MTPKFASTAQQPGLRQPGPRVPSTPYARRLARERGIPLSSLSGTGPNGRLTGRDVLAFVPAAGGGVTSPAPAVSSYAAVAAIAASISLESVASLLPQFDDVEPAIELVDVCLKATAAAVRTTPALAGAVIRFGEQKMAGLERLTLGAIAAMRTAGGTGDGEAGGPLLVLSFIDRAGLRPVAMPMPQGAAARLVVAGTADSARADCLFSYDPALIDDIAAADFLLAFKDAMEIPLRLIA